MQLFIFMSKWTWVLSQIPRTRFQCYWTQFVLSWPWPQVAANHKLRRQGFLIIRNLWLSQFVTFQNITSQIDFHSTRGYTPKYKKLVHIDMGQFQLGFFGTSFTDTKTDIAINRYTSEITPKWAKMGLFRFMSKCPEHVFSVIGLILCRHGLDHKLRQITNCDDRDSRFVTICDCRNLWRFKTQLLRLMSIMPEGMWTYRKHIHLDIGPFEEGFLGTHITSEITPK